MIENFNIKDDDSVNPFFLFICTNTLPSIRGTNGNTGKRYLGPHPVPHQANGSKLKDNVPASNQHATITYKKRKSRSLFSFLSYMYFAANGINTEGGKYKNNDAPGLINRPTSPA